MPIYIREIETDGQHNILTDKFNGVACWPVTLYDDFDLVKFLST